MGRMSVVQMALVRALAVGVALIATALAMAVPAWGLTLDTLNPPGADLYEQDIGHDDPAGSDGNVGASVAVAGDVNGDGVGDYLVGAPTNDKHGAVDAGSVYVIYGKRGLTGLPRNLSLEPSVRGFDKPDGYRIDGPEFKDPEGGFTALAAHFGQSVANAGDVNGDGVPDQLIGAPNAAANNGRPGDLGNTGSVFVVYGRRGNTGSLRVPYGIGEAFSGANCLDVQSELTSRGVGCVPFAGYRIDGVSAGALTGASVAGAGDVNGDGVPDQIIGAPGAQTGGHAHNGAVWIVYGRRIGTSLAPPTASGNLAINLAGSTIGGAIAFNNSFLSRDGYRIDGADGARVGAALAGSGDVNGDGVPDQLVAASLASPYGRTGAGSYYVIYGRRAGFLAPPIFGASVFDLSTNTLSYGDIGWTSSAGYRIDGASERDVRGCSVGIADAGDVNGDGIPDHLLGAPAASPHSRANAGSVWIVYGRRDEGPLPAPKGSGDRDAIDLAGQDAEAIAFGVGDGYRIDGEVSPTRSSCGLGTAVAGGASVDRDAVPDQLLANPDATIDSSRDHSGGAYVVFGRRAGVSGRATPSGKNSIDLAGSDGSINFGGGDGYRIKGARANSALGSGVAWIDDVTGDGQSDSLIGAANDTTDTAKTELIGASYILAGRAGSGPVTCPDGRPIPAGGSCNSDGNPVCPDGRPLPASGSCDSGGDPVCPDGRPLPASGSCDSGGDPVCPDGRPLPAGGLCVSVGPPKKSGSTGCTDAELGSVEGCPVQDSGNRSGAIAGCTRLAAARVSQNVSKWGKFGRAARVRIRGPKNGFFVATDPRSATFSVFRFGVKVRDAKFSLDGRPVTRVRGSRPRLLIKPSALKPGVHKIVAVIRARGRRQHGVRLRDSVRVSLRFRIIPCPPAKLTVRQSRRKVHSGFDLRLGVDSGGPFLSQATVKLPFAISAKTISSRKLRGRVVGKLATGGQRKASIMLKLPKRAKGAALLTGNSSPVRVVLRAGRKPTLQISTPTVGINSLRFVLRGRRSGLFVNRRVGRSRYRANLIDRGNPKSSVDLANTQKIYHR